MPFMRRRPLLRAAAVGGGAYALGRHSARMGAEQQQAAYEQGAPEASAAPAAPPAAGASSADIDRLSELGRLHESGVLTDEEFASEKAKILGG
jgi:hypothetical protein